MILHYKSIPHEEHRYETCGDYWLDENGEWQFRVSRMGNEDYEFLVLIHELTEWYLTQKRGIKEEDITQFDMDFEHERALGFHSANEEPGHDKRAPYRKEHRFAEKIERKVAKELGVNWDTYDETVMSL